MKFLVLLPYYNRPRMVQQALISVELQTHDDYEIAFIDDASEEPFRYINSTNVSINYYRSEQTQENKERYGTASVHLMNKAVAESDADVVFILCDDDALVPAYMENLNTWFKDNPDEVWCWSKSYAWDRTKDPDYQKALVGPYSTNGYAEIGDGRIAPARKVDASQVAWRRTAHVGFVQRPPGDGHFDSNFYDPMFRQHGLCPYSGFYSQYKGIHSLQADFHQDTQFSGAKE